MGTVDNLLVCSFHLVRSVVILPKFVHGIQWYPYDSNMLLTSIGPFAWVVIGIELLVWGFLALALGGKFVNRFGVSAEEINSQENVSPQA